MAARRVEPDQGGRQVDECDPVLAGHLECGGGTESDGFRPVRRHVAAAADLRDGPGSGRCGRRKIETHHLVVGMLLRACGAMADAEHRGRLGTHHIATPIHQFQQTAGHIDLAAAIVGCEGGEGHGQPPVAEDQARRAQAGGHQLLQPQRGRSVAARQLEHEGDAGLLDTPLDLLGFLQIDLQRRRAINGLPRVAGGQNRQRPVPIRGEQQHRVDVGSGHERTEAVHRFRGKLPRHLFGATRHLGANGPHLKPVAQTQQRGTMTRFPSVPQADESEANLHSQISSRGVSCAVSGSRGSHTHVVASLRDANPGLGETGPRAT